MKAPKSIVSLMTFIVFGALVLILGESSVLAQSRGKQLLDELIIKAKQEGKLYAIGVSTMGPVVSRVENAFKKRFNLDIDFQIDVQENQPVRWSQLKAASKAGIAAPYSVYLGNGPNVAEGRDNKLLQHIDNWELLLAEINPLVKSGRAKPNQVSWGDVFSGYAFVFHQRVNSLMYNTRLMSKNEIPQRLIDIKDPKYKGKYPVAAFPTMFQLATLVYPRDELLKVANEIGKNAGAVLTFSAGSQRILLGEFTFMPLALQNVGQILNKDPQAPIAAHYFTDVVSVSHISHSVAKDAPNPAAGTLFALWMTTPEAQTIWQPVLFNPNILFGQSETDLEAQSEVKKSGAKVVSWFDSADTLAALKFYGTKEGAKYRGQLVRALTQRK
jgi:ABC-type Fe3+ transport system substrate-binding protein